MVVVVLYTAAVVDCFPRAQRTSRAMLGVGPAFQLLECQTDVRRCRFDTLGKLTPAHRAGAPTARGRWVCPRAVGESDIPIATARGPPTARGHFILPPSGG